MLLKAGSSKGLSYEITLGSGEENQWENCKKKKHWTIFCAALWNLNLIKNSLTGQILLLKLIPKELIFYLLYSIALLKLFYLIKNHQRKTMSGMVTFICINTKERNTDF